MVIQGGVGGTHLACPCNSLPPSLPPFLSHQSDKADVEREVPFGDGEMLAQTFDCPFFETSAKLRSNIDEAFHELVRQIKKCQQDGSTAVKNEGGQHSGKCCTLL